MGRELCGLTEWHTLVVALQGALVGGFIYTYSTYSDALAAQFNLQEGDKETIGLAFPISNLCTFTTGLIMDKIGVPASLIIASAIMMSSLGLYAAIALKSISVSHPVVFFFALGACVNYGGSFVVGATFTTLANNFTGERRSLVVSIAKAWTGVSAGFGTAVFLGFWPGDCTSSLPCTSPERLNFLYFLAAMSAFPMCISPVLKPLPADREVPTRDLLVPLTARLPLAVGISLALIGTTLLSSFAQFRGPFMSVLLLVLLLLPYTIMLPGGRIATDGQRGGLVTGQVAETHVGGADVPRPISPWEGGPCDMVKRLDFYFLWVCVFCIQSGGLFLTTNLGSMVESRSGTKVPASTCVTVFACSQGLARLVTGSISGKLMMYGWPRTLYFCLLLLIMGAAHLVMCAHGPGALLVGTAMAAVAFGSCYPLLVLCVTEVFGPARVASNYMVFDGTPGAVGTLVFAKLLAGAIYNSNARQQRWPDKKCYGDDCFRTAHIVIASCEFFSLILGVAFAYRSKIVYRMLADQPYASEP